MPETPSASPPTPAALRAGDVVRVVAPAGPCDPVLAWRGLGWLASRYRLRFTRRILAREGYLAGDDASRRAELQQALDEPDVAAVICTRGGYGLSRFVHELDWRGVRARPRWVIGFSDVTALHVELSRLGVPSVHGPNLTGYGRGDGLARAALVDLLERPLARRRFPRLRAHAPGGAEGRLHGGNLCMLHACAAAGRLQLPARTILLLEDVGEPAYRLDRMVTTLAVGGHLAQVRAVVLGEFEGCPAAPDGRSAERVVADGLAPLGVPVVAGLPVGHGARNAPMVLGAPARLESNGSTATLITGSEEQ